MFLVPMRSPRRVEHFAFFARRIPMVRFPYIKKRSKRRKKNQKHFFFDALPPRPSFASFDFDFDFDFIFFYFYFLWDPNVIFSFTSWSVFASKQIILFRFQFHLS